MNVNVTGTTAFTTSLDLCDSASRYLLSTLHGALCSISRLIVTLKSEAVHSTFSLRKMKLLPLKHIVNKLVNKSN